MLHILTDAADFQMCILTSKILLNIFTSSILIILDKDADENVVKYLQYISMGFFITFLFWVCVIFKKKWNSHCPVNQR